MKVYKKIDKKKILNLALCTVCGGSFIKMSFDLNNYVGGFLSIIKLCAAGLGVSPILLISIILLCCTSALIPKQKNAKGA